MLSVKEALEEVLALVSPLVPEEKPDEVNRHILEFLRG